MLWDGGLRGRVCKYSYKLIQFVAQQKLTQYYKATIITQYYKATPIKKKKSVEGPAAIKWAILERRRDEKRQGTFTVDYRCMNHRRSNAIFFLFLWKSFILCEQPIFTKICKNYSHFLIHAKEMRLKGECLKRIIGWDVYTNNRQQKVVVRLIWKTD